MQIYRIELNIRGQAKTIDGVAKCHAIVGPPRSGKTPYLDAIKLAVTGAHEVGGRNKDLVALVSPGAKELSAHITGDGIEASFRATKRGATIIEPTHESNIAATVIAPGVKLWTSGTYLRELVIAHFGDASDLSTDPPEACSESQALLWRRLLSGSGAIETRLGELIKSARNDGRATARAVTITRETLSATEQRLNATAGAETLPKLRGERDAIVARLARPDGSVAMKMAQQVLANAQAQLDRMHNTPAVTMPAIDTDQVSRSVREYQTAIEDLNRRVAFGETMAPVLRALEAGSASCPICGSSGKLDRSVVAERLQAIANRRKQRDAVATDMRTAQEQLQRATSMRHSIDLRAQALAQAEASVASAKAALNAESARDFGEPAIDRGALKQQIETLDAKIRQLESVEADRRALARQNADVEKLETERADYTMVEKVAAARLLTLWAGAKKRCETAIAHFTPQDTRISISEDHEWSIVGVDGREHPFACASGTEQAIARVAIPLAFGPRIVLLDDADFAGLAVSDARAMLGTLAELVETGALDQVIVARNRPEDIPAGYTITETGGVS